MRKQIIVLTWTIIAHSTYAQEKMQRLFDTWPELKEFHLVMSQTFHPSEEGNLNPIKERLTEWKEKTYALSNSKIPVEVNNEKIKSSLLKLKENNVALEKMINEKKFEKEITEFLSVVHDNFHEIIGLCKNEKHE